MAESKADRFRRIATKRMNRILPAIQRLGNLSGSSYEYTPEQAQKIGDALKEVVLGVVNRLTRTKTAAKGFTV